MEEWYVLSAAGKHEAAAAELMERRLGGELFSRLAVPRRAKAFRSGGTWHRMEEILFPGYVFVKTSRCEELSKALLQSRAFPQPLGIGAGSVPDGGGGAARERPWFPWNRRIWRFFRMSAARSLQR